MGDIETPAHQSLGRQVPLYDHGIINRTAGSANKCNPLRMCPSLKPQAKIKDNLAQ